MKKLIYILLGCSLLTYCSKSGDSNAMEDLVDDLIFQDITYEDDIKGIIQTNCIACHTNPPTNGASIPLTTFTEVKNAVEIRDLINKINSLTNPMPPDGRMPADTRRIIDAWVTQGLPEN